MWQQFSVRILASPTLPPKKSFALAEASYSPFLCCSPDKKKRLSVSEIRKYSSDLRASSSK